jgi:acetylornithine/succinyldiaminopimelate/putrescine aminotransferase
LDLWARIAFECRYLLGLRQLCDQHGILLMIDAVQCGHFRSGRFQSYERVLEGVLGGEDFAPDAVSMAKSLGAGVPIGAFWARCGASYFCVHLAVVWSCASTADICPSHIRL